MIKLVMDFQNSAGFNVPVWDRSTAAELSGSIAVSPAG